MLNIHPSVRAVLAVKLGDVAVKRDADSCDAAVGDLQEVLAAALSLMSGDQVDALLATEPVQFLLTEAHGLNESWVVGEPDEEELAEEAAAGPIKHVLARNCLYWTGKKFDARLRKAQRFNFDNDTEAAEAFRLSVALGGTLFADDGSLPVPAYAPCAGDAARWPTSKSKGPTLRSRGETPRWE